MKLLGSILLIAFAHITTSSESCAVSPRKMKTVLITGGNRGLGRARVNHFFNNDWRVLATARSVDSLPSGKNIVGYELDLASNDSVNALVASIGPDQIIDAIIHNAGFNPKDKKDAPGYFESTFYVKDFSAANVAESMMINALHPMELTGKLFGNLSDDAVIIFISSWLGSIGAKTNPGHYGYGGSKALMNMMVKGLALELAKDVDHKRVAIAMNPGWMKTDMVRRTVL